MVEHKHKSLKSTFLFFDAFIFISVCILLGIVFYGVAVSESKDLEAGGVDIMNGYPYLFAIVGFGILVTVIGCWGALVNSRCFLVFYTVMLFAMILAVSYFLVVSILEIVKRNDLRSNIETSMLNAIKSYADLANPPPTNFWDSVQEMFKCCGVNNYRDWESSNIRPNIPSSCCVKPEKLNCETARTNTDYYSGLDDGCLNRVLKYMDIVKYILIAILGLIDLFSIPNFFLGMCVASSL